MECCLKRLERVFEGDDESAGDGKGHGIAVAAAVLLESELGQLVAEVIKIATLEKDGQDRVVAEKGPVLEV